MYDQICAFDNLYAACLSARKGKRMQPDVVQFFPSIDHAILRGILARAIREARTLALIDAILRSGAGVLAEAYDMVWFAGDDLLAVDRPRGLPIGNLTSQFWANVYLNELDQFAKRRLGVKGYIRYVDDVLLFDDDRARLRDWHNRVVEFLTTLRPTVHQRQPQLRPVAEGIPFLGFTVFQTYRRLKRRKVVYAWRRLKRQRNQLCAGMLTLAMYRSSVLAWIAHARHGDTWGLRRALLSRVIV